MEHVQYTTEQSLPGVRAARVIQDVLSVPVPGRDVLPDGGAEVAERRLTGEPRDADG